MPNNLIVYHSVTTDFACPDGICAAWVASKVYPDADLLGLTYAQADLSIVDTLSHYDFVLIVDFSFSEEILDDLTAKGTRYRIIDHHEAYIKRLAESLLNESLTAKIHRLNVQYDVNECGATLTWKTFFPNKPMPVFLEYIRDRDLFNKQLEYTNEVHMAMASLQRTFSLFDQLEHMPLDELLAFLVPIGAPRWIARQEKVQKLIDKAKLDDTVAYFQLSESNLYLKSDIAETLLKQNPAIQLIAITTKNGDRIRLKARKHINLLKTFSDFPQLGGHAPSINFDVFEDWQTAIKHRQLVHIDV